MTAYEKAGLAAGAAALIAWMLFWGNEYADASDGLIASYGYIAEEFNVPPHSPGLTPEANEDLRRQIAEFRRSSADHARNTMDGDIARFRKAKFMMTTVSIWVALVLSFAFLRSFLRRYQFSFIRRLRT